MNRDDELRMSVREAFEVMAKFLERNWIRQNGDLAPILSDIQVLPGGETREPGAWDEWLECVDEVVGPRL